MIQVITTKETTQKDILDVLSKARSYKKYAKFILNKSKNYFIKVLYNWDGSVDISTNVYSSRLNYDITHIYSSGNFSYQRLSSLIIKWTAELH